MQTKLLLLLGLFCLSGTLSAQENEPIVVDETKLLDPPESKSLFDLRSSEFGLNVAPLLVEVIGGYNNKPRYSISYQLANEVDAFRFNIGWTNYDPVSSTNLTRGDSNTVVREQRFTATDVIDFRFGYSRFKQKGIFRLEYGADFNLGVKNVKEGTDYLVYRENDPAVLEIRDLPTSGSPELSAKYNLIGLSPFLGVTAMLGDHWAIQLQSGPDIIYNKMVSPVTLKENNFWEVKYNYLNTVNLMYKF